MYTTVIYNEIGSNQAQNAGTLVVLGQGKMGQKPKMQVAQQLSPDVQKTKCWANFQI